MVTSETCYMLCLPLAWMAKLREYAFLITRKLRALLVTTPLKIATILHSLSLDSVGLNEDRPQIASLAYPSERK